VLAIVSWHTFLFSENMTHQKGLGNRGFLLQSNVSQKLINIITVVDPIYCI